MSKFAKILKKNLITYLAISLGIVVFSTLIYVAYGKINDQISSQKNDNKNSSEKSIIIDAGHGGEDGGAVGIDGIVEKNINLSMSLKLREYLEIAGYNVIMVRDKDVSIYDDDATTLKEKKKSDLKNRSEIINKNNNPNTIFVSIHQNKFPDSKYSGTQIFYSENNPKSEELALSIRDSVVGLIQPENKREIKKANKNIYLLKQSKIPSVVVECGFLSNPEEAKMLSDKSYQSKMAFSICCGIFNYFSNHI